MYPIDIHSINSSPISSIYVKTGGNYGIPDYDAILNGSETKDIKLYGQGDGILTQGKHRMIFFSSNEVHGNKHRVYQGSCAPNPGSVPDITTYLTHSSPSTSVLGLDSNQYTVIEKPPYKQTADDRQAARAFSSWSMTSRNPSTGFELETNLNTSSILASHSPGMHYAGTAKMGTDDGRENGTSVGATNTKVYGMDNLVIGN